MSQNKVAKQCLCLPFRDAGVEVMYSFTLFRVNKMQSFVECYYRLGTKKFSREARVRFHSKPLVRGKIKEKINLLIYQQFNKSTKSYKYKLQGHKLRTGLGNICYLVRGRYRRWSGLI